MYIIIHNYFDAWLCSENQLDQFLEQCFLVKENGTSFYFDATKKRDIVFETVK